MEREFVIRNQKGLHMRAAALLMKTASRFDCEVSIARGNATVNAKSLLGVMGLAASKGTRVSVTTRGKDEAAAMEAITALFNDSFGEE